MDRTHEIMLILQEECAEVTQAISKCFRFGMTECYPGTNITNRDRLEEEIGDLLAMVALLEQAGVITEAGLHAAFNGKIKKLKKWSTIYEQNKSK
jgi:NTP pyrophosphatase (non-canonical NTP hydrolase)